MKRSRRLQTATDREVPMLSQSSISSKGRTGNWAKSFLGAAHREQPVGAAVERVPPAAGGMIPPAAGKGKGV